MRARLLVLSLLLVAATGPTACGGQDTAPEPQADASEELVQGEADRAGHVHGLAVEGETLLIATHGGLWRHVAGEEEAGPVGESRRDLMGFTALGDRLIASGHPDPLNPEGEPPSVGVIESRDGGESWRPVALAGEVDFHALGGAGSRLYGYDGHSGRLLTSEDAGRRWRERRPPGPVIALAAVPGSRATVLAGTAQGVQRSTDGGRTWKKVDAAVGLVAAGEEAQWSADGGGVVRRSTDGGVSWSPAGSLPAAPVALAAGADGPVVALEDGRILESADGGSTFRPRVQV